MSNIIEKLNSKRPICFIDTETTGVNVESDRIIEISIVKINLDGSIEKKTKRFNPEIPIPPEATEVHGITDADVANELPFKKFAKGILNFITDCDLAGYYSNTFDLPLLNSEFSRAGVEFDYENINLYDMCTIYFRNETRTLKDAYKYYCDKELEGAHQSENDILASIEIFEKQLDMYPDLPKEGDKLNLYCNYDKPRVDLAGKFSYDDGGDIIFNFGKHKGEKAKTQKGFLEWMINKAKFSADVVAIVNKLLNELKLKEEITA